MAWISDEVFDAGLDYADTNGDKLDIVTTDPTGTYATVTANSVASEVVNTGAPTNATTGNGRMAQVPAIAAGTITNDGTASHWALTNGSNAVIASGALTTTQVVTSGNTFTLDAVSIFIRDAT